MKKIAILFLIFIITCVCFLSGCNQEEKEMKYSVVGSWKTGVVANVGYTILTLNSDGTAEDKTENRDISATGTWKLDGDIMTLNLTDRNNNDWSFVFKIHFEDNGRKLIAEELSSGDTETWERL